MLPRPTNTQYTPVPSAPTNTTPNATGANAHRPLPRRRNDRAMIRHFHSPSAASEKPAIPCSQNTQRPPSDPTRKLPRPVTSSSDSSARMLTLVVRAFITPLPSQLPMPEPARRRPTAVG